MNMFSSKINLTILLNRSPTNPKDKAKTMAQLQKKKENSSENDKLLLVSKIYFVNLLTLQLGYWFYNFTIDGFLVKLKIITLKDFTHTQHKYSLGPPH